MPSLQAVFWDVDGTLAETELQGHRLAYNRAFKEFGLDWIWDVDLYTDLLTIPGGRQRMQSYSERLGQRLNDASLDRLRVIKQRHYLDVVASGLFSSGQEFQIFLWSSTLQVCSSGL